MLFLPHAATFAKRLQPALKKRRWAVGLLVSIPCGKKKIISLFFLGLLKEKFPKGKTTKRNNSFLMYGRHGEQPAPARLSLALRNGTRCCLLYE